MLNVVYLPDARPDQGEEGLTIRLSALRNRCSFTLELDLIPLPCASC